MKGIGAPAIARTPAAAANIWLPGVWARLTQTRSRWRLWSVLQGVVWSLVLGLVVFCALQVMVIFLDGWTAERWLPVLSESPALFQVALSVIVVAGGLAVTVLVTFLVAPDLPALARAADRAFGLQERLSTALEVAAILRPDAAPDPVRAALLVDAERRTGAVDPRKLVRLTLPRIVWAVPALLVAAILLQVVPPGALGRGAPGASAGRNASDDGAQSRQQAAETAANLRVIAEILDQDAAQRSDPYLHTIARTLERLSTEVAQSTMDRRLLASELDRLLAHAQQAYGQGERQPDQTAARRDPVELLRSAVDEITGNRQAGVAATLDPKHDLREAAANSDPASRHSLPQERRVSGAPTPAEQIAATVRRLAGVDIPWLFVDEDGAEVDPRSQIERLMAEEGRRARAPAQPAGAAANAGVGEGDRAGDGTRPLGRSQAVAPDLATVGEMRLPDQPGNDGRSIRIELAPEAALSSVAPPVAGSNGEWRRVQEQSVERPALAPGDREVVGRYFKRGSAGGGP